jgi:hypothetical protein
MPSIKHPLLGRGLGRLFGILGRGVYLLFFPSLLKAWPE